MGPFKLDAVVGPEVRRAVMGASAGSVVLLENLRFDPREEANDDGFAFTWASTRSASAFVLSRMCAESTWSYLSMSFW